MFITFEGIDGCGKTTQSILLARYMSELHGEDNVVLTREPGGTSFNEQLRSIFLRGKSCQVDAITELFLLLAMRRESFTKVVERGLSENKIVISDRCIDSTVAYQGYGCGIDLALIYKLNSLVASVVPDITFIIDVDTDRALLRADRNGYESSSVDFYNRVREGFLHVAEENKHRCRLVRCHEHEAGGGCDIYSVHRRVVELLHESEACVSDAHQKF
ncbi:dTMP kinase [Candidatus Anaplasma sp. TIGMIC]|uniref:dTMP kinase n=1 Tax=Candidatus Anaplasma sp. TIGMIC TaxID=3020713 RepID=UPI00232D7C44|nr:dTMP kinase [Candidatus Anaplasma sp. TIGMIC]MDB1135567.1 dTMP kinase [Candidatus Anaplasma sp. TIGMIC]